MDRHHLITPKIQAYMLTITQFIIILLFLFKGIIASTLPLNLLQVLSCLFAAWSFTKFKNRSFNIFPPVKSGAELITSGPYKYCRHPIYTSLLSITLLAVIDQKTITSTLLWLALLITLIRKLQLEETILLEYFPQYASYQQNSWKLIPPIY